jgi:plastocyanin
MQMHRIAALSALVIFVAGCGGAGGSSNSLPTGPTTTPPATNPPSGTPPAGNPNSVTIANQAFSPTTLNVATGGTVTWNWVCDDTGYGGYGGDCVSHNVTFDDGSAIASETQSSGTFSRTFNAAGTFKYHCSIHGAAVMSAQIVVK